MNAKQEYNQAVWLAGLGRDGHTLPTAAGRVAFVRTGTQALKMPSSDIEERFMQHRQDANDEIDEKNQFEMSKIKAILA